MAAAPKRPHIGPVDVILATVLVVFTLVGTGPAGADQPDTVEPNMWAYVLAVGCGVAVVGWRRWPVHVFVATGLATAIYLAWGFPFGPILFSGAFAVAGLAASRELRLVLIACAIDIAIIALAIIVRAVVSGSPSALIVFTYVVWSVVWIGLPAAIGITVRTRRDAAVRVRDEQARRTVSEERLRMAQEVHDVVGHGLAVIAMQAGAGLHVLDRDPDKARKVLRAIQITSREALDGLRAELGTLRTEAGNDFSHRPGVGLRDIPALVERVRSAGLDVRLELEHPHTPPPDETDVAAYRIVQEALTNVLRHAAPSATARVRVREMPGRLFLEITDSGDGAPVGAIVDGSGIRGMRQRARRVGGSVEVTPRAAGGVQVTAWLPLTLDHGKDSMEPVL
jgi:signal transduction histidine kinase